MSDKESKSSQHEVHVYGNSKTLTSENQRLVDLVEKIKAEIERQRSANNSKSTLSATTINSSNRKSSSSASHHHDDDDDDDEDDADFDNLCITINSVSRGPGVVNIILGRGVRVYRH